LRKVTRRWQRHDAFEHGISHGLGQVRIDCARAAMLLSSADCSNRAHMHGPFSDVAVAAERHLPSAERVIGTQPR
jgi:hypothetical protein